MSRRTLVFGDIHGGYKALLQLMNRAGVTPSDRLIFLGDYVDGWSESDKVIDLLIELGRTRDCLFIRGNHDQLFADWLHHPTENLLWLKHGGQATIDAYLPLPDPKKKEHLHFLENLTNYHIDSQNRLFVHAGFSSLHGPEMEYHDTAYYWDRTLWETALAVNPDMPLTDPRYPKRLLLFNKIFIGHTPTTRIDSTLPVTAACVTNIDTGAAFKGPLTVMDVDSGEFWQSDPVCSLYPDENGRN